MNRTKKPQGMTADQYQRYLLSIRRGTADPAALAALGGPVNGSRAPAGLIGMPVPKEQLLLDALKMACQRAMRGFSPQELAAIPQRFATGWRSITTSPFWRGELADILSMIGERSPQCQYAPGKFAPNWNTAMPVVEA